MNCDRVGRPIEDEVPQNSWLQISSNTTLWDIQTKEISGSQAIATNTSIDRVFHFNTYMVPQKSHKVQGPL